MLTTAMNSSLGPAVCRVCLCSESSIPYLGNAPGEPLISPCHCKGTMGLYHRSCLEHWLSTSRTYCCEICKFRFEIGRRKRGFISYLRAHSWFVSGEYARSMGSDCACLLILTPLTLGGSILCIQSIKERLVFVNENGDLEKAHEILGLGLMAFFLMILFCFWVLFTVLFYLHDFRLWQKKNMILYVIDQLDRDDETYTRHNHLSESQRPLLLRKKIREFLCCGNSGEEPVIPLRHSVVNVNPELIQPHGNGFDEQARTTLPTGPFIIQQADARRRTSTSPAVSPAYRPAHRRQDSLLSGSSSSARSHPIALHVPSLSTFRPQVTTANGQPSTSTPCSSSACSPTEPYLIDIGISLSDNEPTYSVPPDANCRQPVGLPPIAATASYGTSPQYETPL